MILYNVGQGNNRNIIGEGICISFCEIYFKTSIEREGFLLDWKLSNVWRTVILDLPINRPIVVREKGADFFCNGAGDWIQRYIVKHL